MTCTTLVQTDSALPLVHVTLGLRGGSATDPPARPGLGSLAIRLARRTAGGQTPHQIAARVARMGATLGVDVSPTGGSLFASVLASSLSELLALLRQALTECGRDESQFERLKLATLAELAEERHDEVAVAQRTFREALFGDHPFARPALGTSEGVLAASLDEARSHLREITCTSRLVCCFAGDIEVSEAQSATDALTRGLPAGRPAPTVPAPARREASVTVVDVPDRTHAQIVVGGLGTHPADADHHALLVANAAFGGARHSRLLRVLRHERGLSYQARSHLTLDCARHAFSIWLRPRVEQAGECLQLVREMVESWVDHGLHQEELEQAKSFLVNSHRLDADTCRKVGGRAFEAAMLGLPPDYHDAYAANVRAVTASDVASAVRRRIAPERLTVVAVGPAHLLERQISGHARSARIEHVSQRERTHVPS